jgi:hypothetical protein
MPLFFNSLRLPFKLWLRDTNGFWHPLMFNIEQVFQDPTTRDAWMKLIRTWWWLIFVIAILYMCLIFYGQHLMQNRPRYEVSRALIWWNIILASFSIAGTIRSVPLVLYIFKEEGIEKMLCNQNFKHTIIDFW